MGSRSVLDTGGAWYFGAPGAGKTTLALARAAAKRDELGLPVLVIDSEGLLDTAPAHYCPTVRDAIECTWGTGHSARVIPRGEDDVAALARAAESAGNVVLVIDEAWRWLNARGRSIEPLFALMRKHRHANVSLHLTTQHLTGDVSQEALSCAPELFVFRCTSGTVLERLRREYGIDPATVSTLPRWQYLRVRLGF